MTKISSKSAYPKKTPIVSDYFVGTDSENLGKTVNFGFEATAGLINKLNGTPLINYLFSTDANLGITQMTDGMFVSEETQLNTSLLTKLHVNKFNHSGDNLGELYLFLKANASDFYFKIRNSKNQNNAVYFNIASIADFQDYFVFTISVFKANQFLPTLENLNVYFFDFELKATSVVSSDPLKLDKSTYTGNAQDLDTRIDALENTTLPDAVLKYGEVIVNGTTASIAANSFQWRLNQISFLTTPTFSTPIDTATAGYYRSDLIVGDITGNYSLIKGNEDNLTAPEPLVPVGKIKLALIPIFGATIGTPPILPNYDDKFLKRYKTTYKTVQPIFNVDPSEDDYNVIFNNTTDSEIRIYENGHSGRPLIKNGAIYPFKSMGTGNVTVVNAGIGVTINAPNGLVLNKNQQCYLVKDDSNEWTFINPVTKVYLDLKADKTYVDLQDMANLAESKTYSDSLITQIINDAPSDGNTLKELNDKIITVQAIIGGSTADGNSLVNTVAELLAVFTTFPEGVDLVTLLAGKVNTTDIYNALDCIVAGKVLDARQGKVLNDLITALTNTVSGKENTSNKQNSLVVDGTGVKFSTVDAVNAGLAIKQATLANPITGVGSNLYPNAYALQDGTILYHSTKWFVPTGIVRTSGTTVTSVETQFTSGMVGAKLTINGEWRIITAFTNTTIVTVESAYSVNYSGIFANSWGVYSQYLKVSVDGSYIYGNTGVLLSFILSSSPTSIRYSLIVGIANDFSFGINSVRLSNNTPIQFSSDAAYFGTKDLGLRRNSSGILEIYNGVTADGAVGNRRDLLVRELKSTSSVQVGDNVTVASATNVGAVRYRTSDNNSYSEMCMQTGVATYAWVIIVENNW